MTLTAETAPPAKVFSPRRILALARLELTMLRRNKTALFNALMLGPLMVALISSFDLPGATADPAGRATSLLIALAVFSLVFASYYTLCTTAVARREELTLKRLITGDLTKPEVLVAISVPCFAVILGQVVVGALAIALLVGRPTAVNPVLAVLGLLLGFSALAVLGYATAIVTRTVEAAQITTLLPLGVLIALSGSMFPFALMNPGLRIVAELSPLGAVNALMHLGLSGTTPEGEVVDLAATFVEAVPPTVALVAWTLLGAILVARLLPWEPRR